MECHLLVMSISLLTSQPGGTLSVSNQKANQTSKLHQFPSQISSQSTGEAALVSGVYWVEHGEHIARREVFVQKGTQFPPCPACQEPLEFRLIEQVNPISEDPDFR